MQRTFVPALILGVLLLVRPAALVAADAPNPTVRFLDRKEAATAIVDESMEPYFSLLQPLEMIAKLGTTLEGKDLAAQRDECRERYKAAVREFTDQEKLAIAETAGAIDDALKSTYPLFAATPWSFVKLDVSIEGGMPHTRGPHIVLPDWFAKQFADAKAKGLDPTKSHLGEALIHEQCHVMQRARPALFADLYENVWGFIRAKGLPSCPWLVKQQIVNPDGVDVGWVFPAKDGKTTAYWQPLVTLQEGVAKPRMPKDFVTIGVVLDKKGASFAPRVPKDAKDGKPEQQFLDQIPAYTAVFGRVGENFHPNETFAVMFSWLAMKDHVAETGPGLANHSAVDFTKFREWCRKHFGATPPKGK